jgi:hypothetical protein
LLTSSTVTDHLKPGDTVEFASYTVHPDNVTAIKLPSTVEVGILASDPATGTSYLTNWVVTFTNKCDQYPVLSVGDQIGWTEFVSIDIMTETGEERREEERRRCEGCTQVFLTVFHFLIFIRPT